MKSTPAARPDVAAHQDLAPQEVQLELRRDQRHPNVVRREREAHVEAEGQRTPGRQSPSPAETPNTNADRPPRRTVKKLSSTQRRSIFPRLGTRRTPSVCRANPSSTGSGRSTSPGGPPASAQPVAVPGGSLPRSAMAATRCRGRSHFVGVGVMAGVLALPPAVADPDQQVGHDEADPVVPPAGLEHLPVGGVVAEEGDLGHDHGERPRRRKLPPAVADRTKAATQAAMRRRPNKLGPVVAVTPAHQAQFVDLAGEGGEMLPGEPVRPAPRAGVTPGDGLAPGIGRGRAGVSVDNKSQSRHTSRNLPEREQRQLGRHGVSAASPASGRLNGSVDTEFTR